MKTTEYFNTGKVCIGCNYRPPSIDYNNSDCVRIQSAYIKPGQPIGRMSAEDKFWMWAMAAAAFVVMGLIFFGPRI